MEPVKFDEEHLVKCKELKKLIDQWFISDYCYPERLRSGCYVHSMIGEGVFGASTLRIQFGDQVMLIDLCIKRERIGFIIAGMYVSFERGMQGYEKGCPDIWEYFYKCLNILIQDFPIDLLPLFYPIDINKPWFEAIVKTYGSLQPALHRRARYA